MHISTTSIRDNSLHLSHDDLRKMLSLIKYPDYLQRFDALSVMIVCIRGEQHAHDAYVYQGDPYVSIALDPEKVAGLPFEEITLICKNELIRFLESLESIPVREAA